MPDTFDSVLSNQADQAPGGQSLKAFANSKAGWCETDRRCFLETHRDIPIASLEI